MQKIKNNIDKLKNNNFIKEILAINEDIYLVNVMYYGVRDSQIQNIYFILFYFIFSFSYRQQYGQFSRKENYQWMQGLKCFKKY